MEFMPERAGRDHRDCKDKTREGLLLRNRSTVSFAKRSGASFVGRRSGWHVVGANEERYLFESWRGGAREAKRDA